MMEDRFVTHVINYKSQILNELPEMASPSLINRYKNGWRLDFEPFQSVNSLQAACHSYERNLTSVTSGTGLCSCDEVLH